MRWEKRKTLAPELRQRPWRRMTSYYDSTRRLEQYFTWNSEESLTNALDIFLHKSFAYYTFSDTLCGCSKNWDISWGIVSFVKNYSSTNTSSDSTLRWGRLSHPLRKIVLPKKKKISFQHDDYWILLSMSRTMELHYLTSQIQLRFHESLSRKLQCLLILLLAWIFFLERSRHNSIKDIVPLCITNASIDELFHFRNQLNR